MQEHVEKFDDKKVAIIGGGPAGLTAANELSKISAHELIKNPPKLHRYNGKAIADWKLADDELLFLDSQLVKDMKTIETGAGLSTIVFAMKGTKHTCIVPDMEQVDRIKTYCNEYGLSHTYINFIIDKSEYALPHLDDKNYDLALIDGRHGFPAPFIDWFYIADILKIGGIVIIDDLHIWTCELLKQFLLSEENWELTNETVRAATFIKQGEGTQHKEWIDQVFVLRRSRSLGANVLYLLNILKRMKISLLRKFRL